MKAYICLALLAIVQLAVGFQGIFTNREFGSNSRMYMCEVPCDITATGKVCYEGSYTRSKTAGDSTDQALLGVILGSATGAGAFKGIWIEAGGLWGSIELTQYSNKSIDGFWVFEDGYNGQGVKYRWYDDLVSETVTADQCHSFVGTRPTQSLQGRLVSRNPDGINHVVCPGATTQDADAGSYWVGVGTSSAYNGTQQGRLFGYNGAMVWAGSWNDRIPGKPHSFQDENGGASLYKLTAPGAAIGAVWVEPNGLYTSSNLDTFTLYSEDTYDYYQESKTYEDCYPQDSDQYFWTGTFRDPYGGYQYLCPQAGGVVVGSFSLGYTDLTNVNTDVVVGKNPRMIGYVKGTPSNDDTKLTGTWFEPDADLSKTTGVFEWTKLNSTHRESRWWYGSDKTKAPEAIVVTERVSIAASDYLCRVIPESGSIQGTYGSQGFDICIKSDKSVAATYDQARGNVEGVAYLNNSLIIGKYTQGTNKGVSIISKFRLYEDSIDGILWNTQSGDYRDGTFDERVHAEQTSTNSGNCNTPATSPSPRQSAVDSTSAATTTVVNFFVLLVALLVAYL